MFCRSGVVLSALALSSAISSTGSSSDSDKDDTVVLRLSLESQELMKKRLEKIRIKNNFVEDVIVANNDVKDRKELESLYGERAAFRLKGYVSLKDDPQQAVGFGSVRGMGDEIRADNFSVSMPCIDKTAGKPYNDQNVYLPTRIEQSKAYQSKMQGENKYFSGRLLSFSNSSVSLSPVSIEAVKFHFDDQLVVDGVLCPLKYLVKDQEGKSTCKWNEVVEIEELTLTDDDLSTMLEDGNSVEEEPSGSKQQQNSNQSSRSDVTDSSEDNSEDGKKKCPICAYIENGPCKAEFNAWESCMASVGTEEGQEGGDNIEKCFPHTNEMMSCFMKHEYYDIMTAGMHDQVKQTFGHADHAKDAGNNH